MVTGKVEGKGDREEIEEDKDRHFSVGLANALTKVTSALFDWQITSLYHAVTANVRI